MKLATDADDLGSLLSILSIGSIASIASIGSIGSLLSVGSIASIGSVGSIASVGRTGAVLNYPVAQRVLAWALGSPPLILATHPTRSCRPPGVRAGSTLR